MKAPHMPPTEDPGLSIARPDARDAKTQRHAELQALLARVEAATRADRKLDALIECAARWQQGLAVGLDPQHIAIWRPMRGLPGAVESQGTRYGVEAYTASLDAALALVERVLPGWSPAVRQDPRPAFEGLWHAFVARKGSGREQHATWGSTPALALLAALLMALSADTASPTAGPDRTRDTPLLNTSEVDEKR